MSSRVGAVHLLLGQDMEEGSLYPVAGGEVWVRSARAPDKEGPNEDAAVVIALGDESGLVAVADGLGGRPAGASAAASVLRALVACLEQSDPGEGERRAAVLDALEQTNRTLLDQGVGAATTFAAVEILGRTLRPYHVGDSAIVVVGQRGKVKLQTVAHSPVGYAVESGLLDAKEAMHHEERHLIDNVVGAADMRIELGSPLRLAPRDTVLVATDGLFDNLHLDEIAELVRGLSLAHVGEELSRRASERMRMPEASEPSKPDDLTVVLYRSLAPRRRRRRSG